MLLIVDEMNVFWVEIAYFQFEMLSLFDIDFLSMIMGVFYVI